jgi:phosphotransacetylase
MPQTAPRRHQNLIRQAGALALLRTAVVHPVDAVSLQGAIEAASQKLIVPVMVGPEAKIPAAAEQAGVDLAGYELVPTEHSHEAAARRKQISRSSPPATELRQWRA